MARQTADTVRARSVETRSGTPSRTVLGSHLQELRRQIEAEGQATLGWDEVERELLARRGPQDTHSDDEDIH